MVNFDTNFLCKGCRPILPSVQRTNVAVLAVIAAANANSDHSRTTVPVQGRGWTSTSTTTCKASLKKVYLVST